jgi:hypothetical protein
MRNSPRVRILAPFIIALFIPNGPGLRAQTPAAEQQRINRNLGMDDTTFGRLFSPALRQQRAQQLPSVTPEALADQVSEIRIFLTGDNNVVVGELSVSGATRLNAITLPLEQGPVTFTRRDGRDSVFTARFRMDTNAAWRSARAVIGANARATATPAATQYIRRGPRDIVPAAEALTSFRTHAPATLDALTRGSQRAAQIAAAETPQAAARAAGIDITRTPFLRIPGPGFDPRQRFIPKRFFDIPVFDIFPLSSTPVPIDEMRSLMIVHPSVIDNSTRTFDACTGAGTEGGPWSFGHLFRELAHGTGMTPENFALHWLSNWVIAQEANGFIVNEPGRATQMQNRIIASWQRLSGAALDIDKFPARLLAIVNRPDLADKIGYGQAGTAGEGRLVFGLVERTAGGQCNNLQFTVIFEYGIKGGTCSAVKAWHQKWKDLDAFTLGSAEYNAALEVITRAFTDHGSNPAQLPNQSSLNQLRTNENALDPIWQLREFRLQSSGTVPPGIFDLVTVKQTPDDGFNNTPVVAAYIVANETEILGNRHVVPERFPEIFNPFMAARSNVPFPPSNVFWNAPGLTTPPMADAAEARRKFSLGTCNACHGAETSTLFTHIGSAGTRSPGAPAALSGFLTGIDVTVPVTGGIHHYADLAERELAMSNILNSSCFALAAVRRIPFVH